MADFGRVTAHGLVVAQDATDKGAITAHALVAAMVLYPPLGQVSAHGIVVAQDAEPRAEISAHGVVVALIRWPSQEEDEMTGLLPWNRIRVSLEVVAAGVGQTGLTPTVAIQRLSDGYWLASGGASWAVGVATNPMVEVSAGNLPGLYEYAIPADQLTYTQGRQGYRVVMVETVNAKRIHKLIYAEESPWEEARADHNGAANFGGGVRIGPNELDDVEASLFRILGTRQENTRVINTAWSTTSKQPTAGYILVYESAADLAADVAPWALAVARYDFEAVYSGALLSSYTSTKVL